MCYIVFIPVFLKITHNIYYYYYREVVREDMKIWSSSRMWPFSCYSCVREGKCVPQLDDVSPEELRWKAYQAKHDATALTAYHEELRILNDKASSVRRELEGVTAINVQSLVSSYHTLLPLLLTGPYTNNIKPFSKRFLYSSIIDRFTIRLGL